jgi:hypothetical protein
LPEQKRKIWVVTTAGAVTLLSLDHNNAVINSETQSWAIGRNPQGGGNRTFVLEDGSLVIGRVGGDVWWIHPEYTTQADIDARRSSNYYKISNNITIDSRVCIQAYRKDGKRYLAMSYGHGRIAIVDLPDTKPLTPNWSSIRFFSFPSATSHLSVGYSCYVDQQRLIYYTHYHQTVPKAFDLRAQREITIDNAISRNSNLNFTSSNLTKETAGVRKHGSYAMAGDNLGNVLNGVGYYTFAYEPLTRTIWGTGNQMINIFPQSCFYRTRNCHNRATYNVGNIGPLSSLGGGFMVGLARGNSTDVYLMQLANFDANDITRSNFSRTRIARLPGDAYMYVDFTGATLYMINSENFFDLSTITGYNSSKLNGTLTFTWHKSDNATSSVWSDIKLEAKCYNDDPNSVEYETSTDVIANAGEGAFLKSIRSCAAGERYNKVAIRLSQLNNKETLMNVKSVSVGFKQ